MNAFEIAARWWTSGAACYTSFRIYRQGRIRTIEAWQGSCLVGMSIPVVIEEARNA